MRPALAMLVAALALGASACSDPSGTSAPPVPTARTAPTSNAAGPSEPAPTPPTHAGTPVPEAPPTATAKDAPANNPQGELSKAEENTAMPKAGQANNHSSPAFDPKKAEPKS